MSKLHSILYHDPNDENRTLDVRWSGNQLFITIQWLTGKGGLGAVRAESFLLESDQAHYLANDILERFPNPMVLEDNLAALD